MLKLYYAPGACSMASHVVLEESGEKYKPKKVDLAGGEQRTDAYLKINPQGRVPVLRLDNGDPLAENTAILPYLGKRFDLWPKDPRRGKGVVEIGFFAAACIRRTPMSAGRSATPPTHGLSGHQGCRPEDLPRLSEADRRHAGRARMAVR